MVRFILDCFPIITQSATHANRCSPPNFAKARLPDPLFDRVFRLPGNCCQKIANAFGGGPTLGDYDSFGVGLSSMGDL